MYTNIHRIYEYLKTNGPQTTQQLASALGMTSSEVHECSNSEENNLFWLGLGYKLDLENDPPESRYVVRPNIRPRP